MSSESRDVSRQLPLPNVPIIWERVPEATLELPGTLHLASFPVIQSMKLQQEIFTLALRRCLTTDHPSSLSQAVAGWLH